MDYAGETINTAHSLLPMCSLRPEQLTRETLSYKEMATPCLTAPSHLNRQKSLLPGLLGPKDMRVVSRDGPLSYIKDAQSLKQQRAQSMKWKLFGMDIGVCTW